MSSTTSNPEKRNENSAADEGSLAEANRIARELGHDSFAAAPPTVRRNIAHCLPDGITVVDGPEEWFQDLVPIAEAQGEDSG